MPVYVVVFGSEKEYAPYRFNEFATAYYFGGADRDYIVMGRTGEQAAQIAVHEYVHLVARHAGLKFPPWLNEGIAELYSTIRMQGDKVLVGDRDSRAATGFIAGQMGAAFRDPLRGPGFALLQRKEQSRQSIQRGMGAGAHAAALSRLRVEVFPNL